MNIKSVVFYLVRFLLACSLPVLLFFQPICGVTAELVVPDDYDTISDAMDEAQYGDTVIVKPGEYKERVKITNGTFLVSYTGEDGNELVDGPGQRKILKRTARTIIDGADIPEPGYLVSFPQDTPAPMSVDGFTIRNMPKYQTGVNYFLVEVRGCSPELINNVIYGNKSWGAVLTTGLGVGMGPALDTVARPLIANNVIFDNLGPGIANGANSAGLITENEIYNNSFPGASNTDSDAAGIGMRSYARPVIINNDCYQNGAGVGGLNMEDYKEDLIIRGNRLMNNRRAGVGLRVIEGTDTHIKVYIEDNQISGNLKAGIMLQKIDDATIRNNTIFDNRKAGILATNVDELVMNDNEIYGNLTAGIRLLDVPVVAIRGNHIYRNVTAGIDFIGWKR